MFNLKNKKAQLVQEKYLRENTIGPKADDSQPITEKSLVDRQKAPNKPIESSLSDIHDSEKDAQIIEKALNSVSEWRTAEEGLSVPPINTLVARMEEDRRKGFKTEKKKHWSQSESDQTGSLPKWPKNAPQHDKTVLQNDPGRFKSEETTELVGGITVADLRQIVQAIKTGETIEYDAAILAIQKEADSERRELTAVEQNAIAGLKLARTKAALKY